MRREVNEITPSVVGAIRDCHIPNIFVTSRNTPLCPVFPKILVGDMLGCGEGFIVTKDEREPLLESSRGAEVFVKPYTTARLLINNELAFCLSIEEIGIDAALSIPFILRRVNMVKKARLDSVSARIRRTADIPWRFHEVRHKSDQDPLLIPITTSGTNSRITVRIAPVGTVASNTLHMVYDNKFTMMSILSSRLYAIWASYTGTALAKVKRHGIPLVYNTFPWDGNGMGIIHEQGILLHEAQPEWNTRYATDIEGVLLENDRIVERIVLGRECGSDEGRLSLLLEKYKSLASPDPSHSPTIQPLF